MAWQLDPEVGQALAPIVASMAEMTPPPPGDVATRRVAIEGLLTTFFGNLPAAEGVTVTEHSAAAEDGHAVPLRLYAPPADRATGGLVLYLHGGGMIMGSVQLYDPWLRLLAARSGAALLAPEYRLAPEHPHPIPVEDCYATLRWAAEHAAELGHDPARIGVAGDSAGGGLAAGVALLARDRGGPPLARQVLMYPMLDDRNTTAPAEVPGPLLWSYEDNVTGWNALLGDALGGGEVSPYAAPARADDVSGLPPTYLAVGDMDIFREEGLTYAARLTAAGVPVEFHLVPGGPHAFDYAAPGSTIGQRALADEARALGSV